MSMNPNRPDETRQAPGRIRGRRTERGQSLIFAAITLFALAMMSLMILGIAESSSMQMRLQNAADSAAYAGAQVEADIIAQVAWMNEGMSALYYPAMRYSVDTATYATLAELEDVYEAHPAADKQTALGFSADMDMRWRQAYDLARTEVPRCERWMERLSKLQRGIASIGADLVDQQVRFTANANGAESTAMYRNFRFSYGRWGGRHSGLTFLPNNGDTRRVLDIHAIGNPGGQPWEVSGWQFVGLQPAGSDMTFMHTNHVAAEDYSDRPEAWKSLQWHDEWEISINEAGSVTQVFAHAHLPGLVDDPPSDYPASYLFRWINPDGSIETRVVEALSPDEVYIIGPNGRAEVTRDAEDGSTTIVDDGGNSVTLRHNDEGKLEYWEDADGDGERDAEEWSPVAEKESITVNGVEVPVAVGNRVSLGSGGTAAITNPVHLSFGRVNVWLTTPLRFSTHFSPFGRIEVGRSGKPAHVHHLNTNNADGRWRHLDDVRRHRMVEVVEDQDYRYTWEYTGALMTEMSMDKFAAHAIIEYDPDYGLDEGDFDRWSVPNDGDTEDWASGGLGGPSLWAEYPKWAQPGREPLTLGDYDLGGFYDIRTGSPNAKGNHHLHQTRKCWYCANQGTIAGQLYDIDENSERYWRTIGARCERPSGFWHETFTDPDVYVARINELRDQNVTFVHVSPSDRDDEGQIVTPYPGQWAIQIRCPVECEWDFRTGSFPKAYEATIEQMENGDAAMGLIQTRVRRYLYHAYERIRINSRPDNPDQRRMDNGFDDADPLGTADNRDFYALHLGGFKPPLELTRNTFLNSINVATWAPALQDRLWQRIGGAKNARVSAGTNRVRDPRTDLNKDAWQGETAEEKAGIVNPYDAMRWGHYAMATARLHFPVEDAFGRMQMDDRFAWGGTPVDDYEWDPRYDPQPKWNRVRWLQSAVNLFEPDWTARLVRVNEAIDLRDEYPPSALEVGSPDYVGDSGTALLMRQLMHGAWRKSSLEGQGSRNADPRPRQGLRNMVGPPMQNGRRINWNQSDTLEAMDEVFQH